MEDKLAAKRKEVEGRFKELEDQRQTVIRQRADLDRQIAALTEEQVRLQGEFRVLEDLSAPADKSKEVISSRKKKK